MPRQGCLQTFFKNGAGRLSWNTSNLLSMLRTMLGGAIPPLIILLYLPTFCVSSTAGTLSAFLGYDCTRASLINQKVNISVGTCLVTSGARGIAVRILPPCSIGAATLAVYGDNLCADPLSLSEYNEDNCYYASSSGYVAAVQFVCPEVAGGSEPTSTTTATFGSSFIPVASGTPFSGIDLQPTTPSSNDAAPTANLTSSSPPTSNTVDGDGNGRSGSGLSHRSTIALGVAIPVAAMFVALLAWWFPCRPCRKGKELGGNQQSHTGQLPTSMPPHYPTWNSTASPIHEQPATTGGYQQR